MATKKEVWEQEQIELAKRIKGVKPPPVPRGSRERIYAQPILAEDWQERTRRRVFLICQCEMPPNATKFVEAFIRVYGSDKLPYYWVSGGRNTLFRERLADSGKAAPTPDAVGVVGLFGHQYSKKEEQRRIFLLKAEQLELEMKFGCVYDPAWDQREKTGLTTEEWDALTNKLKEAAAQMTGR